MREYKSIIELMGDSSDHDIVLKTDQLYEKPFCEVVKDEVNRLDGNGRLFIPVFNKMGMKYWAGCQHEDGYAFTKKELTDLLESLEIKNYKFLYPYPDHVYPMAIYSDEYLPKKGELTMESFNLEKERLVLFHEAKAYDMIINENLFPQFSNSFLVVIGSELEKENKIFTKFSYERAKEFAIKTDIIVTKEKEKVVKKSAMYPEGESHIHHMHECFKGLAKHMEDENWETLSCEKEENALVFPFVKGETLADQLYVLVKEENRDALLEQLKEYISKIQSMFGTVEFKKTEEFEKVFGKVDFPENRKFSTSDYNNIDLVLDNMLVDGKKHYFIDYEWTFDFPVPFEYTIYRILHYFICRSENKQWLEVQRLYEEFGVAEEVSIYEEMEKNFQKYIEGMHTPLREVYEEKGAGRLEIGNVVQAYKKQVQSNQGRIYFDYGQGFSENDVSEYQAKLQDGICKVELDIPEGIKAFRIDPIEDFGCLLQIEKFEDEKKQSLVKDIVSNGKRSDETVFMFGTKDPWIQCKKSVKKIYLEYRISACDDELLKKYDKTANIRKVWHKIFR